MSLAPQSITTNLKSAQVKRSWQIVDAKGRILGQVASEAAMHLMGKNRANYTPNVDSGDYVVVINASGVAVTGNKLQSKIYRSHSGRPGGFREENLATRLQRRPELVIEKAVAGMLPKNRLQQPRLKRLKVYAGNEHPHASHFTPSDQTVK